MIVEFDAPLESLEEEDEKEEKEERVLGVGLMQGIKCEFRTCNPTLLS